MSSNQSGVLGIFSHMDTLIDSIHHYKEQSKNIDVYAPCPRHEIAHAMDEKVSPVRRFTLIGGLTGCTLGYLFTSFASLDWILPTSGKPIVSLEAFTVIAFELTILFGSIFTVLGVILNAKLFRRKPQLWHPRLTDDKFGIFVPCQPSEYETVAADLKAQGAEEVKRAE